MKHVISVPWTDEERTTLRQMWQNGMGCTGIGRHLGRSKYSVRSEIETLQLGPRGSLVAPPRTAAWPSGAGTSTASAAATRRPYPAAAAE
jgi:hypothetical protein